MAGALVHSEPNVQADVGELRQTSSDRLLLFFCVLLILKVPLALGSQSKSANNIENNRSVSSQTLPAVDRAVTMATAYLERACDANGKFTYQVNTASGLQSGSYNIIRHAGTIYALSMLNRSQPDRQVLDTMLRATAFLQQNYIAPGIHIGQLAVWSDPVSGPSPTGFSVAELGATSLGLVALAEVDEAAPGSIPLAQLEALGRFVLFLQKDDGSFIDKYVAGRGPVSNWASLYYPGEAALGLILLYKADHSHEWLVAAAKALRYLARTRAGLVTVPADHWALIATAELIPYSEDIRSTISREEMVRHAIQICTSILREQITTGNGSSLDGAFDPLGRTAPAATRLEGLLAALEFLPVESSDLRTKIVAATERGINFLLRSQIVSGKYAGGLPGATTEGARGGSAIRIDYVQHALCAWLRYERFQNPGQAGSPILGNDAGRIRVLLGGDTDFGESYQDQYAKEGASNVLAKRGYEYCIAKLARLLEAADYRILNLETPLTLHHDSSLQGKAYLHYSDPVKAPAVFRRFGPITYSLANNHTLDQGERGLYDTIASLKQAGARFFGAGKDLSDATRPFIQEFRINDATFTVAIFGGLEYNRRYEERYRFYAGSNHPGVAPIDVPSVEKAIHALRQQTPTIYVIYFMHTLGNYEWKTPQQVATAQALRNSGVDLVIGSGAHMMQEAEYDGREWIFYGIGNFLFNAGGRYADYHAPPYSLPLMIDFSMDDGHLLTSFRAYPILSDNKLTDYQTRLLSMRETGIVNGLLATRGHWGDASTAAVTRGEDEIGYYLEFSRPADAKPRTDGMERR